MEKTIIKQDYIKPILVYRDPKTNLEISRVIERDIAVIGRSSKADISIEHDRLSRNHFMIYKEGGFYKVKDLESTNGIIVNNSKVKIAVLSNNSKIIAGGLEFVFLITNKDFNNNSLKNSNFTAPVFEKITTSKNKNYKLTITNNKIMLIALLFAGVILTFFFSETDEKTQKTNISTKSARSPIKTMEGEIEQAKLSIKDKKKAMLSYKLAEHHFKFSNYKLAKKAMMSYLELVPNSDLAPAFIANCEVAIKKLSNIDDKVKEMEKEEQKQETIKSLLKNAKQCMANAKYDCAIDIYERILEIDEYNKEANDGILKADNLQAEIEKNTIEEKTEEPEAPKEVASLDYDKEWDLKAKQMQINYNNKDYVRAYEIAKDILKEKPEVTGYTNQNEASKIKNSISHYYNKKFAAKMRKAKILIDADAKNEAVKVYKKILRRFPYHKPARMALSRIYKFFHEKAKKLYAEAVISDNYGDPSSAKAKLKQILHSLPKNDKYYRKASKLLKKILKAEEL